MHFLGDFEPSNEEIEERDRIVADLESYIRQFFQTVTLKLFGSSANGFGFQGSDLDICLTFDGNPSGAVRTMKGLCLHYVYFDVPYLTLYRTRVAN